MPPGLWYDGLRRLGADHVGLFAGLVPVEALLTTVALGLGQAGAADVTAPCSSESAWDHNTPVPLFTSWPDQCSTAPAPVNTSAPNPSDAFASCSRSKAPRPPRRQADKRRQGSVEGVRSNQPDA